MAKSAARIQSDLRVAGITDGGIKIRSLIGVKLLWQVVLSMSLYRHHFLMHLSKDRRQLSQPGRARATCSAGSGATGPGHMHRTSMNWCWNPVTVFIGALQP